MCKNEHLISLVDVRKVLLKRTVLDIKRLDIQQGECAVVNGANGAGKTTLLKILAGLIAPEQGTFIIDGKNLNWKSAFRIFRKQVVYLHQTPYLFDRSVKDNVAYGLHLRKLSKIEIQIAVKEALEWAGLSALAERNARDLSNGEKQRVALTRARILDPKLLLLDEPTTAMDSKSREHAYALIRDLANSGNSVYIATHESVSSYQPQRIISMRKGKVV